MREHVRERARNNHNHTERALRVLHSHVQRRIATQRIVSCSVTSCHAMSCCVAPHAPIRVVRSISHHIGIDDDCPFACPVQWHIPYHAIRQRTEPSPAESHHCRPLEIIASQTKPNQTSCNTQRNQANPNTHKATHNTISAYYRSTAATCLCAWPA